MLKYRFLNNVFVLRFQLGPTLWFKIQKRLSPRIWIFEPRACSGRTSGFHTQSYLANYLSIAFGYSNHIFHARNDPDEDQMMVGSCLWNHRFRRTTRKSQKKVDVSNKNLGLLDATTFISPEKQETLNSTRPISNSCNEARAELL